MEQKIGLLMVKDYDLVLVAMTSTEKDVGHKGISCFIVEKKYRRF